MRDYLPIPLNGVLDSCNTLSWTVTLVRKLATKIFFLVRDPDRSRQRLELGVSVSGSSGGSPLAVLTLKIYNVAKTSKYKAVLPAHLSLIKS